MGHPGPVELGRGVVVAAGAGAPDGWERCRRVRVSPSDVVDPESVVAVLHEAWLTRQPVVIELAADADELRAPERHLGPVYDLAPGFDFTRERLQFLVWANTYDARGAEPVWWHGRKAARRFAAQGVVEGGPADILLADGTPLLVDGGPPDPPPLPGDPGVVHRWSAEAGRLTVASHGSPAADLAPDQLAAVAHGCGPARVIAPAGSGKTRVLTERLRHLVGDRGVHPGSVCAVAYNTRAADELHLRCAAVVTSEGPAIRTLNSLGLWICNRFGATPPGGADHGTARHRVTMRLQVLDEPAVREVVQRVFTVRRQANTDTVVPYIEALSAIRLGLMTPAAAEAACPDASGVADGFDRYRAELARMGALDFDEQIYRAIEILVTDPTARWSAQARCRRLLVDEFQDLTPAHVLLIRLLAAPGYDCFGVGDDDQVIYGYAGASPEFLIEFPRLFPGAAHHPLEVNYRCPPPVVTAAVELLSYSHRRLDKTIRSAGPRRDDATVEPVASVSKGPLVGAGPLAVQTAPASSLAALVLSAIDGWTDAGVGLADIAVLARVNAALLPVQVACLEAGVLCSMPLGTAVLARTGIRTALAYLRLGSEPDRIRAEDVRDTIRRPSRGIAPMVVDMATKGRWTSVADIRRLASRLTGRDAPKVLAYADDLERVVVACGRSTADAVDTIRTGIGLDDTMDVLDSSRREVDRSTHRDDLVALASVALLHPEASTFEPWLRDVLSRPSPSTPAVELSTVHRIKGKEWSRVVVFHASQGLFPHRLSDDDEGERRVFHVALTRARDQVLVLGDVDDPSPFIAELDGSAPRRARPAGRRGAGGRDSEPQRARPAGQSARTAGAAGAAGARAGGASRVETPLERSLREWRSAVARREKVPAYVVLNDQELIGIAERAPGTLSELAACRGMGPIRLERWGDELLSVLGAAST